MKFKKFLCLTLATTIAFTATLSSSVSIFAEDIQETEESQSFGSFILEKMTCESEDINNDDFIASPINQNNDSSEITPMWNLGTHEEIITNNNFGYIPKKYVDLVVKICKWCDDPSKISKTRCLHGSNNYAASLKLLWKYAQVIGNKNISGTYSQLSANARKVSLALFDSKVIKRKSDKTDYNELVNLAVRAEAVINCYGKTKTPKERKYLIWGMILHLIGDINAHRTVVPKFLVARATDPKYASSENRFDMTKFHYDEWQKIVDGVNNGTLCFSAIKRKLRPDRQSDAAQKDKNSIYHQIRRRYEDNPKVVPNRLLSAETMAEYFMRTFSKGFNIAILDNIPYANVTLINYRNYRNEG